MRNKFMAFSFSVGIAFSGLVFAGSDPSQMVVDVAKKCATSIDPLTMSYVVAHESSNNPLAINVNNSNDTFYPETKDEAKAIINRLDKKKANYDIGLAQINSGNFKFLKTDGHELLGKCENLKAAEVVLSSCYERAIKEGLNSQENLHRALSCYNTGDFQSGLGNGYVKSVQDIANNHAVPRLQQDTNKEGEVASIKKTPKKKNIDDNSAFGRDDSNAFNSPDRGAFYADRKGVSTEPK